jgi:hypothetical protein
MSHPLEAQPRHQLDFSQFWYKQAISRWFSAPVVSHGIESNFIRRLHSSFPAHNLIAKSFNRLLFVKFITFCVAQFDPK